MTINELRARLREAVFDSKYADCIESQAQRCVRFQAIPTNEEDLPLGCSKLGGSPDLPVGVSWPSHGNRLLDFRIQIDLQDLNQYRFCKVLPSEGHLYIFLYMDLRAEGYDPSDRENWRFIYHPGPREDLQRRPRPELGLKPVHFNPCRIAFHEALSPGWDEIPIHALRLDDDQQDEWQYFIDCLPEETNHQLLGRPGRIQDLEYVTQLECQFLSNGLVMAKPGKPINEERAKEVAPGATDWKLLLQLDSDKGAGMDWGDSMISFWIRERDLQERNFSQVWMVEERF